MITKKSTKTIVYKLHGLIILKTENTSIMYTRMVETGGPRH